MIKRYAGLHYNGVESKIKSLLITIRVPIFQNYSQIVETYGKEKANNIVSNCDAFLFLGGSDEDTLKIIQSHLGKTTVKTLSGSYSQGKGSNSNSKQQTGMDLMTRDQIETMSNAECLLFIRALRPFKTRKYDLNRHENYKYLSEGDEGEAYANPFLLDDDDELIEGVRIKNTEEDGYIEPKVVNSARRRNLIETNRKKVKELRELLPDLIAEANSEKDPKKAEKTQQIIKGLQEEIEKLERILPECNGELEREEEYNRIKREAEKTGAPVPEAPVPTVSYDRSSEDIKTPYGTIKKGENFEAAVCEETKTERLPVDDMTINGTYEDAVSIVPIGGYASAYEFDSATDFRIDSILGSTEEEVSSTSSGSDMSKEIPSDDAERDQDMNDILADLMGGSTPKAASAPVINLPTEEKVVAKAEDTKEEETPSYKEEKTASEEILEEPDYEESSYDPTTDDSEDYDPSEDILSGGFGGFDDLM